MPNTEGLDDYLLEALGHLYDPDYTPPELMYELTGYASAVGATPVQTAVIQALEALQPQPHVPSDAHLRRVYEILHNRFVLKLTQERTAELMGISVRHLNRVQREAVHTLAQRMWEERQARRSGAKPAEEGAAPTLGVEDAPSTDFQASDWQTQTQRELASLYEQAPDAISDVSETIHGVIELQHTLPAAQSTTIKLGYMQPGLTAAVHPSVLRQMLITVLGRLNRFQPASSITIFTGLEEGNVRITITATFTAESVPVPDALVRDTLAPSSVSVEANVEAQHVFFTIRIPSAQDKITVLVVDDNEDMVHFYRRVVVGTRYHVIPLDDVRALMPTVDDIKPDIIVLDVMLPNVDGWQLLMQLHEDPTTRHIPVIICTVVREEALALSLGAARHLAKPVRPREFIQALDQVMPPAPTETSTAPAPPGAPYS